MLLSTYPLPSVGGILYFCFAKIAGIIVDEYEQRAVYKRYDVISNGPDSVLETSGTTCHVNTTWVSYDHDEQYFVCTHSANAGDRHRNQAYLPGTGGIVMTETVPPE